MRIRFTAALGAALALALGVGACGGSSSSSSSTSHTSVADTTSSSTSSTTTSTTTTSAKKPTPHKAHKPATHTSKTTSTKSTTKTSTTTTHTTTAAKPKPKPKPKPPGPVGPVQASFVGANHAPLVGHLWFYTVTARDARGTPLTGTVDTEFVFNGTVVGHEVPPTHPLVNGHLHDGVTFPAESAGVSLVVRVVIHTKIGTVTLNWPVKPRH